MVNIDKKKLARFLELYNKINESMEKLKQLRKASLDFLIKSLKK